MENTTDAPFDWLSLTTHRDRNLGPDETTYFQYEAAIAAISIIFFRFTVRQKSEPRLIGAFFALILG